MEYLVYSRWMPDSISSHNGSVLITSMYHYTVFSVWRFVLFLAFFTTRTIVGPVSVLNMVLDVSCFL
jgi:hypothetical protein